MLTILLAIYAALFIFQLWVCFEVALRLDVPIELSDVVLIVLLSLICFPIALLVYESFAS